MYSKDMFFFILEYLLAHSFNLNLHEENHHSSWNMPNTFLLLMYICNRINLNIIKIHPHLSLQAYIIHHEMKCVCGVIASSLWSAGFAAAS